MITLQKVGDALKFTFTDNPLYLQNGTIEVPVNSLTLVTDNSGIATFKKSASNDIFVCASYDELGMSKAELENWFKENAVGGGSIDSGAVQTMIDASISGKQDTLIEGVGINIDDNVISVENPSVYLTQAEYDALVSSGTVDPDTYYVISDATAIDINQYYTSAQTNSAINAAVSGKQDTLSAGTGIQIDSANTISCTVTPSTYSAGRGIDISNNTISTNLNVYSGQGVASVSLCNSSGNGGGESSIAGMASVGGGFQVTTKNYAETAFGTNNQSNGFSSSMSLSSGATLFSVGNGTGNTKHNAFEIRQNGDIYITSGNSDIKLQDAIGGIDSGSVQTMIDSSISAATDDMATESWVGQQGYQTSGDVQNAISGKADASAVYTKSEVDDAITAATYDKVYSISFDGIEYGNINLMYFTDDVYYEHLFNVGEGLSMVYGGEGEYKLVTTGSVATSAITSAVTSGSTDSEIPTAKAVFDAIPTGSSITVSSAITSGDTNPIAGGAVYDKFDEVETVTARALIDLNDKFGGLKLQQISQADYDALVSGGTVDASTLYIINNVVN